MGNFIFIDAGAVVTTPVPDYALFFGPSWQRNPVDERIRRAPKLGYRWKGKMIRK